MANGILNGTDLKVYITPDGGSATLIAYATNATITSIIAPDRFLIRNLLVGRRVWKE